MTHEFGHWLGMMHTDQSPDCSPGVAKTGIMRATLNGNQNPQGLSDQDKCQFMKLYCPSITSVKWDEVVSPVPGVSGLLLQTVNGIGVIQNVDCEVRTVLAYTTDGRNLGQLKSNYDPGSKKLDIDFSSVPDGALVLVFDCAGKQQPIQRLFLIQRVN